MKHNFYVTFGVQYGYEPHPRYDKANPNGWLRIVATSLEIARRKAFELLGPHFATMYSEKNFDASYFPNGEIESIECV